MSAKDNSIEAKIVILGSQGVGKTSLVHRFVNHEFTPSSTINSTIGASFLTKRLTDIDSATIVRLQIWDTAGQERFRSISRLYYRGANAAILCYDITSTTSFTELTTWLHELKQTLPTDTVLHIVGTKADLVAEDPSKRKVAFESCVAYAAENLYPATNTNTLGTNTQPNTQSNTPLPTPLQQQSKTASSLLAAHRADQANPLGSPNSNRSSMGFWGQDLGWDSCHEVSASTGEGVEEVFRVITRRLVDQRNARAALEARLLEDSNAMDEYAEYAAGGSDHPYMPRDGGSFRVGLGDKRRSWLGLPQFPSVTGADGERSADDGNPRSKRGPCCT